MSVCRKLPDGTIQKIAGHTILLDANASEVRQGTVTATVSESTNEYNGTATFSDPMPDNDYAVILNVKGWDSDGYIYGTPYHIGSKTTTGFTVTGFKSSNSTTTQIRFDYYAFKPIKLDGYTALQNKINNPDETPTIDSMNLVTSDGVARAIENASAVWKGTKSEWTALPVTDKKSYDLAVLVDAKLIKAVDRTDGSDTDVADLGQIWKGTRTEWESLSLAERKTHGVAFFTDKRYAVSVDPTTGDESNLVDWTGVWKGSMEDWEALTDAEKDEWDVCITPTIAASDTNPFRTLSDPETLTIAPNTDYTCPHDGFIIALPATVGIAQYYVNGVIISMAGRDGTAGSSDTFPVQKGDVFKYTMISGASVQVFARWYTNEVSPGETDTPVLYRSQSLDWDNAVVITGTDLSSASGWIAPADGYAIIGYLPNNTDWKPLLVNGISVTDSVASSTFRDSANLQIPVSKGDVIKGPVSYGSYEYSKFIPYKDYPDYSTTEHWTGRRWIDGRKVYSKTFTGRASNGTSIQHGITGLSTVVSMSGCISDDASNFFPLTSYDQGYTTRPSVGSSAITWVMAGFIVMNYNLTVEYTKTTD